MKSSASLYGIKHILKRFISNRMALVAGLVLFILFLMSYLAPVISNLLNIDSDNVDLLNRFLPASNKHFLGTDALGRDVFLRLLYGGQVSLNVGIITALLAAIIGTTIGLTSGFLGGKTDAFLMRITDGIIILPLLPFLIILTSIDWKKLGLSYAGENINIIHMVCIIAVFGWTTVARLVRAQVYVVKEQDYITAARALGVKPFRIMIRHILPNVIAVMIVAATLSIGNIILLESVLSFLGLGIQPPTPSWGNMLSNAQELVWDHPLMTLYPGIMIFITVMAFNIIGDGLQDALNPKSFYN